MHVWAHSMCTHGCSCLQMAEEGGKCPGVGVIDSCEPPDVYAKSWISAPTWAARIPLIAKPSLQSLAYYFKAPNSQALGPQ